MSKRNIPTEEESIKSFDAYNAIMKRIAECDLTREEEEMLEIESHKALHSLVPRVGLKCTMVYWSDYRASTIVEVVSEREVVARHNVTKCKDWYASTYDIEDGLEGGEYVFTKRKNGRWILKGQPTSDGVRLALNYQRHYIDPSF